MATERGTDDVERVLGALADPTRREVLETLARYPAASASALARELPITRQMVLRHLTVLQEAGLVHSARSGREVLFQVDSEPLADTAQWFTSLAARWDSRLADLKARAEEPHIRPSDGRTRTRTDRRRR